MTKQQAIELENKCDELMTKYLEEPCVVSMSLSGRLKVSFGENYITLDRKVELLRIFNIMDIMKIYYF